MTPSDRAGAGAGLRNARFPAIHRRDSFTREAHPAPQSRVSSNTENSP